MTNIKEKEEEIIAFSRKTLSGQFHTDKNLKNWDEKAGMMIFAKGDRVAFVNGDRKVLTGIIVKLGWLLGPANAYPGVEVKVDGTNQIHEKAPVHLVNLTREKVWLIDYAEDVSNPLEVNRKAYSGIFVSAHLNSLKSTDRIMMPGLRRDKTTNLYISQTLAESNAVRDHANGWIARGLVLALHQQFEKEKKEFKNIEDCVTNNEVSA